MVVLVQVLLRSVPGVWILLVVSGTAPGVVALIELLKGRAAGHGLGRQRLTSFAWWMVSDLMVLSTGKDGIIIVMFTSILIVALTPVVTLLLWDDVAARTVSLIPVCGLVIPKMRCPVRDGSSG